MDIHEKVKENRLRRWARRLELDLRKSRARHWSIDDQRGYMLVDYRNVVILGARFDRTLDDIEAFLAKTERELQQRAGMRRLRKRRASNGAHGLQD